MCVIRKKNIFLMLFKSNYGINKPRHCCVYRIVGTHFQISVEWWQPLMLSTLEHSQWCLQFTLLFIIELWYSDERDSSPPPIDFETLRYIILPCGILDKQFLRSHTECVSPFVGSRLIDTKTNKSSSLDCWRYTMPIRQAGESKNVCTITSQSHIDQLFR